MTPILWLNLEKKHWINEVKDGTGEETTAKKVITFHRAMTKKGREFFKKTGETISCRPG